MNNERGRGFGARGRALFAGLGLGRGADFQRGHGRGNFRGGAAVPHNNHNHQNHAADGQPALNGAAEGGNVKHAPKETRPMGWARLKDTRRDAKSGELEGIELIRRLTTDGSFVKLFEGGLDPALLDSPRRLSVLGLLAKGAEFDNSDMRQTIVGLLGAAIDHKVIQKSADSLLPKIMAFSYRGMSEDIEAILEELGYVLVILRECISRMLTRAAVELLPQIEFMKRMENEELVMQRMDQETKDNLNRLKVAANAIKDFIATGEENRVNAPRKTRRQLRQEECEGTEPPEDYRELPIVPTADDVLGPIPYLRRNVIKGAYKDEIHYLDIQFRLLREDYIHDLRKGIKEYSPKDVPGARTDMRIYRDAKIDAAKVDKSGMMLSTVTFDTKPFARIKWEASKRLIYGSLLCFSSDEFKADLVFAVVQNRDIDELKKGCIDVMFENPSAVRRERTYVMAETSAYFESYRHVLEGLKRVTAANFPFMDHLVACNSVVPLPQYLGGPMPNQDVQRYARPSNCLNFAPLINPDLIETRGPWKREVGLRERWPRKEEFGTRGLDESQFEALFHALNHRIAIIQGPPGTGKTFIGLQIMRLLLDPENQRLWNPARVHQIQENGDRRRAPEVRGTPILVVCYTNHALDQFLEGIVDFDLGKETKIIRVGGRSKVERLAAYNLFNARQGQRMSGDIRMRFFTCRSEMEGLRGQLLERATLVKLLRTELPAFADSAKLFLPASTRRADALTEEEKEFLENMDQQIASLDGQLLPWLLDSAMLKEKLFWLTKLDAVQRESGHPEPEAIRALLQANSDVATALHHLEHAPPMAAHRQEVAGGLSGWAVAGLRSEDTGLLHSILALSTSNNDSRRAREWLRNHNVPHAAVPLGAEAAVEEEQDLVVADQMEDRQLETEEPCKDFKEELKEVESRWRYNFLGARAYEDLEKALTGQDGFQEQNKKSKQNRHWETLRTQIIHTLPMTRAQMMGIPATGLWELTLERRWALLNNWRTWLLAKNKAALDGAELGYSQAARAFHEIRHIADTEVMRSASVIGMTTTGAARYQSVLQTIKPPIVIVEEAAEVFEAHLLTSLSSGTQHLIMIGDHKQLRPSPAVYTLEKDYHLDISLFERLINNGFAFAQLEEQHRMRPEISGSLMPHFYDNLRDHPDVAKYENVAGMALNMMFFNHSAPEAGDDSGDKSKKNVAEAKMVAKLAAYLRQQDYAPDRITVLACYVGQMFELRKLLKANPLTADIRIAVVDNYQGEECDIIILSMVRSNNDGKIGFLKTDNRVCVALSRAKMGFYCLGNFDFLAKHSTTWEAIRKALEGNGQIGDYLGIKCVNHNEVEMIRSPEDFSKKAPEGGCTKNCNIRLTCGHACQKMCHAFDRKHEKMNCSKKCAQKCPRNRHDCPSLCSVKCPPCRAQINHELPCGHWKVDLCHCDTDALDCPEPCPRLLRGCGHRCAGRCSTDCPSCTVKVPKRLDCGHTISTQCRRLAEPSGNFKCEENVEKTWPGCLHSVLVECHVDVFKTPCPKPCGVPIPGCEHLCTGTCGACRNGRLHVRCQQPCKRPLICGHECEETCSEGLGCGPCRRMCETSCPHSVCGEAGRKGGAKKKREGRRCGAPCPPCSEDCSWSCPHFKCAEVVVLDPQTGESKNRKRKCHEPCERPRCSAKCGKLIVCPVTKGCRFPCRGVCEPQEECIKICPKCQPKEWAEVTAIFFGTEDEEDTVFVSLRDCGHILAVDGVDHWVDGQLAEGNDTAAQIGLITCPKCKTPIRKSLRYGAAIKKKLNDIESIKRKQLGNQKEIKQAIDVGARDMEQRLETSALSTLVPVIQKFAAAMKAMNIEKMDSNSEARFRNSRGFLERLLDMEEKLRAAGQRELSRHRILVTEGSKTALGMLLTLLRLPQDLVVAKASTMGYWEAAVTDWLSRELTALGLWVLGKAEVVTDREMRSCDEEIGRLSLGLPLASLLLHVARNQREMDVVQSATLRRFVALFHDAGTFDQDAVGGMREKLKELARELSAVLGISEEEKRQILAASRDMGKGHWYKCPNGHLYVIGDCGGATVEAKCPECKATIGGGQHRLRADNTHAGDFDGSTAPAWPPGR